MSSNVCPLLKGFCYVTPNLPFGRSEKIRFLFHNASPFQNACSSQVPHSCVWSSMSHPYVALQQQHASGIFKVPNSFMMLTCPAPVAPAQSCFFSTRATDRSLSRSFLVIRRPMIPEKCHAMSLQTCKYASGQREFLPAPITTASTSVSSFLHLALVNR
jgi:hypothetical protein